MQTKLGSFVEAWANIAVGFAINYTANLIVLPWFGFNLSYATAFYIGVVFTVISLVRSYVLRRWFNGLKFGNKPEVVVPDWNRQVPFQSPPRNEGEVNVEVSGTRNDRPLASWTSKDLYGDGGDFEHKFGR